jgi:hypothetical protein
MEASDVSYEQWMEGSYRCANCEAILRRKVAGGWKP